MYFSRWCRGRPSFSCIVSDSSLPQSLTALQYRRPSCRGGTGTPQRQRHKLRKSSAQNKELYIIRKLREFPVVPDYDHTDAISISVLYVPVKVTKGNSAVKTEQTVFKTPKMTSRRGSSDWLE